jgi:hypothetical protein
MPIMCSNTCNNVRPKTCKLEDLRVRHTLGTEVARAAVRGQRGLTWQNAMTGNSG